VHRQDNLFPLASLASSLKSTNASTLVPIAHSISYVCSSFHYTVRHSSERFLKYARPIFPRWSSTLGGSYGSGKSLVPRIRRRSSKLMSHLTAFPSPVGYHPSIPMDRDLTPDWILQETLNVQTAAIMNYANSQTPSTPPTRPNLSSSSSSSTPSSPPNGLTLTVLGCGTMGIAILGGILDSLTTQHPRDHISLPGPSSSGTATPNPAAPARLPTIFNACVRRRESAKRIRSELSRYPAFASLTIYEEDNVPPVAAADVVLLACKPQMVHDVLRADGMREALAGKLLISICAGVTEAQIAEHLTLTSDEQPPQPSTCTIVRAMPNTAAAVRESMTVIGRLPHTTLPAETDTLITWIFTRIGRVVHLPASTMDVSTALCGSGPAFVALILESLAAGAIAMGLPREEAYLMAAQTMRGTTGLLLSAGEHPAILRDKVSTPGGCTIGGLLVLEEGMVRGTVAKAVREATVVAGQLGKGVVGVNGTRLG